MESISHQSAHKEAIDHMQFEYPMGIGFNCTNSKLYDIVCDNDNHTVDTNFAFSNFRERPGTDNSRTPGPGTDNSRTLVH